jgi:3-phenylpropionate/cinnamic acid dioxygenase small subunit
MTDVEPGSPVNDEDFLAIQRFLHREAALLDRRDYVAWLDLLTPDIVYRVTLQTSRYADAGAASYAIVDERIEALRLRVEQIATPRLTHAENPPTLARRFVSNLEATDAAPPDAFVAETNILVYRNRITSPDGILYVGARRDVLRRVGGGLRIARRDVALDQTSLRDGSLSLLL